jgi:hypothetical protein
VTKWLEDPGLPLPILMDDVLTLLDAVHTHNCLSHEFDTELFRSLTDSNKPTLVHTIYPEPHSGKSAALHAKMWLKFIQLCHDNDLSICCFTNDCCTTGLGATKIFTTPTVEMIALGVTYVGLSAADYQHFAPNFRPVMERDGHEYTPPAVVPALDISHHVRTARRNYHNINIEIVFYSEKGVAGVEGIVSVSLKYLTLLAQDRRFKGKYGLSEMATFDTVMDQKGDASWFLHSQVTIDLLRRECPTDRGTILALQAMYFICAPFKMPDFTNPFMVVSFLWRGLAVWETQELYVRRFIKRVDLHCPSPAFRESNRILAHGVINLILVQFTEKLQNGDIQFWVDIGLHNVNNDCNEEMHSEERSGGILRWNHDSSVDSNQHCTVMTKLQQVFDRRPRLKNAGLKVGGTRRNKKTRGHKFDLGLPAGITRSDICYGPGSRLQVPDTLEEFKEMLEEVRQEAYATGLEDFWKAFPEDKAQFEQFQGGQHLPRGVEDRTKLNPQAPKHPPNKSEWLVSGDALHEMLPARCIGPEDLVLSDSVKNQIAAFEKSVAAEQAQQAQKPDGGEDDQAESSAHHPEGYLTPAIQALILKIKADRAAIAELMAQGGNRKVWVGHETDSPVQTWERLLKGDSVLDSCKRPVKVSRILRAWQLRDNHSRGRGERFWVGRLRSFKRAIREGHNVTLGTCLLVKWGGKNNQFAVVRVMGIIEDSERCWSCNLLDPKHKGAQKQAFQVELLDPIDAPESGSQRYGSSGYSLPKLAASMVLQTVELMHLDALAKPGEQTHDALLRLEDIVRMNDQGYKRVTASEGFLHIENEAEQLQSSSSSVMWNAQHSKHPCFICEMSFFDANTGLIVRCKTCDKAWHQECHSIKIRLEDTVSDGWECGVCSGDVEDVCCHCQGDWIIEDQETEEENDRLLFCEGVCGRLWHQKCHYPAIKWKGESALWRCFLCESQIDEVEVEDEAVQNSAWSCSKCDQLNNETESLCGNTNCRLARSRYGVDVSANGELRSRKRALPGSSDARVTRVDGVVKRGLRIHDPSGTRLDQGIWTQNHVHA